MRYPHFHILFSRMRVHPHPHHLQFQVLDQQGENTVYITLVDDSGASWSGWSSDEAKTALNTWKTIEFDYTAAASAINLTQIAEVRLAQWNAGTYRFADVALVE